jgi:tetratricopeptide (TPR) repeat protein
MALEPERARSYSLRARAFEALGDLLLAEVDYDQAVNREQKNPEAYLRRGEARLRLKNYDGAQEDAEQILKLKSRSADGYHLRARVLLERAQYRRAEADWNIAIQLAKSSVGEHFLYRGMTRILLGRDQEALQDFARCLELEPSWKEKVTSAYDESMKRRPGS